MLPVPGLKDQVTAVFEVPLTLALNCCVCPAFKLEVAGLAETATVGGGC